MKEDKRYASWNRNNTTVAKISYNENRSTFIYVALSPKYSSPWCSSPHMFSELPNKEPCNCSSLDHWGRHSYREKAISLRQNRQHSKSRKFYIRDKKKKSLKVNINSHLESPESKRTRSMPSISLKLLPCKIKCLTDHKKKKKELPLNYCSSKGKEKHKYIIKWFHNIIKMKVRPPIQFSCF